MALAHTGVGGDEYGADVRLVTAHRTGDREAFETIVASHYTTLLAWARRRLGNPADAEDAVQETFLKAFRALDHFGDTGDWRLGAWLNTILGNVCKDIAARRKPLAFLDDLDADVRPQGQASDVADLAPDPVALEAVTRAILSLPDARRQAFLLRMVSELPYDQVAGEMGISEDNARAYVSRACRALRRSLEGVGAVSGT
ncbi:MAG: RNA polymerase sigma factor, partial [Acidimicrobiales bacterium]